MKHNLKDLSQANYWF